MVNKHDINNRIMPLIEKIVHDSGLVLVEADFTKDAGRWLLKIFIYKPDGPITHEDCEIVTRNLDGYLDEIIPVQYRLEVSSPGMDRKLKSEKEYHIFKGKKAKVKLKNGDIYTTEINDDLIKKYVNNEITYTKLEPEYNF